VRRVERYWRWVLVLAALVATLLLVVPVTQRPQALHLLSLIGILLLALPAIRVNEQGRLIERVRALQAGIRTIEATLRSSTDLAEDVRRRQTATLEERRRDLEANLDDLLRSKGAWTPRVHAALHLGYAAVLAAAIARVLAP
jgi:hypothetical protein